MFVDIQQNTDEWFDLRKGRATSSNFAKIMANYGKAFGKPAIEYAQRIALEIVTGNIDDSKSISNSYMDRGHEFEPVARDLYERETFSTVTNGGFFHKEWLGDSPDGNVGEDGCIEIKCVIPNTQWLRLINGGFDTAYKWQIYGHILLGNKKWCDFVSYCPEMPTNKQLHIYRVTIDEESINMMMFRFEEFRKLINDKIMVLTDDKSLLFTSVFSSDKLLN